LKWAYRRMTFRSLGRARQFPKSLCIGHNSVSGAQSGRRRRACTLTSVRRSNCTCGFPAYSFHEDSFFRDAGPGINRARFTTCSINEWSCSAPVELIQSTSFLGRECTGISLMELIHLPALAHLVSSLSPTAFAGCLSRPIPVAGCPVTRLSPRFRYYTAVRLLTGHRSPLRLRL